MNLTKLVREPFTQRSWFDFDKLEEVVPVLVRMLDNVLDLTTWPLPEQQREAQAKRRIGIGITGLGDAQRLPDTFESVATLEVADHLEMLKVLAPYVDAAISKTVNVPADYGFDDFKGIYLDAWKGGLKGITTYRPNSEIGSVLISSSEAKKRAEDLDSTTRTAGSG